MSATIGPERGLEVRLSRRRQVPSLAVLAVALVVFVVGGLEGFVRKPTAVLGTVVFAVVLVVGITGVARSGRAAAPLLCIGPSGVDVCGARLVPWGDLESVTVTGMRPRWLFWFSLGHKVVAFVPRPGVELPAFPARGGLSSPLRRPAAARRLYGSPLTFMTYATTASVRDVTAAVEGFGHLPVVAA